ncbi:hypothetical protein IEQ34_002746 [Dendrobium chrysotoxum]|uniref:Uncharacterized protein n=1 Tax=Dendrobium chrysotoxum TaxID=161865 RepID=A0AAV7HI37_DENCH|nr:hypothetical protein IEQ34_002746 [Dendrobium chrysotoxum]
MWCIYLIHDRMFFNTRYIMVTRILVMTPHTYKLGYIWYDEYYCICTNGIIEPLAGNHKENTISILDDAFRLSIIPYTLKYFD